MDTGQPPGGSTAGCGTAGFLSFHRLTLTDRARAHVYVQRVVFFFFFLRINKTNGLQSTEEPDRQ